MKTIIKKILDYRELGLIVALVLLVVAAGIFTPSFFGFKSISSMVTNNAIYAILTVGMTFVILTGGIDISVGSVLGVSGVVVTRLLGFFPDAPVGLWVVVGLVIGSLCGALNGFFAGKLKIAPMIVTLATMYIFRGLAFVISGGEWTTPDFFPSSFTALSQREIFGIRSMVYFEIAIFVIAGLFLGLTKPGRRLYAVGTSEKSAVISGINVGTTKFYSYILCGACAGLSGVLYAANYATVNSEIGTGYEMTAIAICILGGVSIVGGRGRIDGIVIASVLMSVITYILSLFPGFSLWQSTLQGAIIIFAVAVNLINGKFAEKRALRGKEALI